MMMAVGLAASAPGRARPLMRLCRGVISQKPTQLLPTAIRIRGLEGLPSAGICLRSCTSSTSADQLPPENDSRAYHDLDHWLRERKVFCSKDVAFREMVDEGPTQSARSSRGLYAAGPIQAGQLLVAINKDICLASKMSPVSMSQMDAVVNVAKQIWTERKLGPKSALHEYLSAMPEKPGGFLYLQPQDIERVMGQKDPRMMLTRTAISIISNADLPPAGRWAVSLVLSRAMRLSMREDDDRVEELLSFTPVVDMANHSFEPNSIVHGFDSAASMQAKAGAEDEAEWEALCESQGPNSRFAYLVAKRDIKAGEQITISYSNSADPEHFICMYGIDLKKQAGGSSSWVPREGLGMLLLEWLHVNWKQFED